MRRDEKRIDIDYISLEIGPIESLVVELDDSPVDRVPVGGDPDGVYVED